MPEKIYIFHVELSGTGANPDQAWEDAAEALSLDPGECPDYEIEGEETPPPNPHAPYMSDEEYVEIGGGRCPNLKCGSADIEGEGESNFDGDQVYQGVRCNACGATWNDVYHLTGYGELEVPNAEQA